MEVVRRREKDVRYFDARTNRPAMVALATVLGAGLLEVDQEEQLGHRSACS